MKLFQIIEARRNPEINKKISAKTALKRYQGRDDIFITFVDDIGKDEGRYGKTGTSNVSGAKFGFNPRYSHNTPFGIYGYPIEYVLKLHSSFSAVPYAGNRPYIWVMQISNNILNLDTYTQEQYKKDKLKISQYANALGLYSYDFYTDTEIIRFEKEAKIKTPGGMIWNVTREIARAWTQYRRETEENTHKLPIISDRRATLLWRKLFLYLGYEGVIDSKGIIHGNEPVQGVFFTSSAAKPIELIHNIDPKKRGPTEEQLMYKNGKRLLASYQKGMLSFDEVINFLSTFKGAELVFRQIPFFDMPEEIRTFVLDNLKNYIHNLGYDRDGFGSMEDIGATDLQKARVLDAHPQYITLVQHLGPICEKLVREKFELFIHHMSKNIPISIEERVKLFLEHGEFESIRAWKFRRWLLDKGIDTLEKHIAEQTNVPSVEK